MAKKMTEIPKEVMEHLRGANVVLVATMSDESQLALELLSWIWPMDAKTVRLVISPNFPGGINLAANGKTALQVIGDNLCYEVRGTSHLVKEQCDSVKFPETMYDMAVEEVRTNTIPASHPSGSIPLIRDEGTEDLHKELDAAMYEEIKSTPMLTTT
ncbi:MAG: hypothetical protein QGG60_00540 [Anaerolineales bacterium]|jgi:hypothetical protein|nr:hypothetical protein [Anaerolineales bacterium]|tara:strand:+ start:21227 stop:21697 length:471 start_codon:yes stop_codon:yes gene_type:complete